MIRATILLFAFILSINPVVNAMDKAGEDNTPSIGQKLRKYIEGTTNKSARDWQKRFVFTGAPSAGKSTIIENLARLQTLGNVKASPEAATDHIRKRQEEGCDFPWATDPDFQAQITHLINLYETTAFTCDAELILLDRSTIDSIAYQLLWESSPMEDVIHQSVQTAINESLYETTVFLIESIGFIEDNGIRCEDDAAAIKIANALEECYSELGFELIRIPNEFPELSTEDRVKARMQKILTHIADSLPQPLDIVLQELNEMTIILKSADEEIQ